MPGIPPSAVDVYPTSTARAKCGVMPDECGLCPFRLAQMRPSVSLILAFIVLALDFVTKRWVEAVLIHGQQIPLTGFFNLVLAYNAGAAFSFLSDADGWQRWFFSLRCSGCFGDDYLSATQACSRQLFCVALSLILGGALGNLWDRITLGHVVDFLDFHVSLSLAGVQRGRLRDFPRRGTADCR